MNRTEMLERLDYVAIQIAKEVGFASKEGRTGDRLEMEFALYDINLVIQALKDEE